MWHLRRVHMQSIGHPDARFDPLTLNFVDENGDPASSVIWLENMGGKTSWLSLVFTVIQPALKDFLGKPEKRLGEYVASKDTAHVILDFAHVTGARTLKGTGARLVIGQTLQWKGRRQDMAREATQLDRRFWGAVVNPAASEEDSFFERAKELTFTEEGYRAPLDAFTTALNDEMSGDVFRPDNNQSKWTEWLTRHGLDPTVFKHQIKMSEDEGSISEHFKFQTGDELVQWALPYIVRPDVPDLIAKTVDEVRATLQRKPQLETEQRFCREIEQLLAHTATQQKQLERFREEATVLWDESLAVVDQMRAARDRQWHTRDRHVAKAHSFKAEGDQAQTLRNRKQGQLRTAEYVLAQLRYQECDRIHEQARQAADQCQVLAEAWGLTESLRKKNSAEQRLAKVEAQLQAIDDQTAPKRAALKAAADRLSIKIWQLLETSQAALSDAETRLKEATVVRENARKAAQKHHGLHTEAVKVQAGTQAKLEALAQELDLAVKQGTLATGQSIEEALEAAQSELQRARAETDRLAGIEADAKETLEAAEREATAAARAEQDGLQAEQQATARLDQMEMAVRNLFENETVARSFQTADPDPWSDGPAAMRRLGDEADRATSELVAMAVDSAEDTRALGRLERDGILPPRVDVEKVLETLSDAGVRSAFSGWEVLRTRVPSERRKEVIETHPELVEGVLLTDAAEMEVAEQVARQVVLSQAMALAPADTLDAGEEASAQVVVLAGPEALYDETAADQDKQQRQARLDGVEARRVVVREEQDQVEEARAAIRHFLTTYPSATARELREVAREKAEALMKAVDRTKQVRVDVEEANSALRDTEQLRGEAEVVHEQVERRLSLLEELETSQKPRQEMEDQLKAATARVQEHSRAVKSAEEEERKAADQMTESSAAKLEATSRSRDWEGKLERHHLAPIPSEEDIPEPLDVLEQSYLDAQADLKREAAPHELTTQRGNLAGEITGLQRRLQEHDAEIVAQAIQLLSSPEGADSTSRREASRRADSRHQDALKRLGAAESDLKKAQAELDKLEEGDPSRRTALDSEPTSIEEAESLRTQLSEESGEALRRMNEAQAREQHHQQEARRAEDAATDYDNAASDLAKVLSRYAEEIGRDSELPNQKRVAAVWSGEPQNARDERTDREDKLVDVGDYMRLAVQDRNEALEKVRHLAEENRALLSAEMPTLMPRLTQGSEEQRGGNASGLAQRLQDRAVSIEKQLGEIEEHRKVLVDQLASQTRETVKLLARLQNRTTLPEGLSEWSGRPYLTLTHPALPETSDELKGRVAVVVDQICNEPGTTPTDGITLLYKSVSNGVGGPFTARILKPNKALKRDRVDISEMATFSGGQKVTSALIMFAALTRMRAEAHATQPQAKAVVPLLLDNPIGKANQATLIEVQQRVADAYGLQLIYTTGIDDIGALASFRVIVRIEGMADTKTGRVHLQVDEEASQRIMLDSIRLIQHEPGSQTQWDTE